MRGKSKVNHKKFLEEFATTGDIKSALKSAGVKNKRQMDNYIAKYKNKYKAFFEKLNMPEEKVLKKIVNLTDAKNAYFYKGECLEGGGNHYVQLNAAKLILELMGEYGDKSKEVPDTTDPEKEQEDKEREMEIYTRLKTKKPEVIKTILNTMQREVKKDGD